MVEQRFVADNAVRRFRRMPAPDIAVNAIDAVSCAFLIQIQQRNK